MEKVSIPLLLGTNREGRVSEHAARWVFSRARSRGDIEPRFFDVREFALPHDDYGQALKDQFIEYKDAIIAADGLIIVSPEYNHGYPGALKSVLDLLLPEYKHKAVGIVSVSASSWGGTRMIENLLPVLRELGLVASKKDLQFPRAQNIFNKSGDMKEEHEEEYAKRVGGFFEELVWLALALRRGRENTNA